jgi:hypothetical protein
MMEVEVDKPDFRGQSPIPLARGRPEITRSNQC